MQKISRLQAEIASYDSIVSRFEDLKILAELADEEDDEDAIGECFEEIEALESAVDKVEISHLLSGPHDSANAIMSIHPGAGGTESQDWAEMLMRMYARWAERNGYTVEVADLLPGEEAGIKSATLIMHGHNAYG